MNINEQGKGLSEEQVKTLTDYIHKVKNNPTEALTFRGLLCLLGDICQEEGVNMGLLELNNEL